MTIGFWAGAGWGVAGGLAVALVITLWVLTAVLGLLRKNSPSAPDSAQAGDVLPLREQARGSRG